METGFMFPNKPSAHTPVTHAQTLPARTHDTSVTSRETWKLLRRPPLFFFFLLLFFSTEAERQCWEQ